MADLYSLPPDLLALVSSSRPEFAPSSVLNNGLVLLSELSSPSISSQLSRQLHHVFAMLKFLNEIVEQFGKSIEIVGLRGRFIAEKFVSFRNNDTRKPSLQEGIDELRRSHPSLTKSLHALRCFGNDVSHGDRDLDFGPATAFAHAYFVVTSEVESALKAALKLPCAPKVCQALGIEAPKSALPLPFEEAFPPLPGHSGLSRVSTIDDAEQREEVQVRNFD